MNKWIKYTLLLALIVLVGYNSIYFRKLSDVRDAAKAESFDAGAYSVHFLHTVLPASVDKAIDLPLLSRTLSDNPSNAFSWSHAPNDGNTRFFFVKGAGVITRIDSESAALSVEGLPVVIETKYIIGNAARDGSGLITVDDFTTMTEMNAVSEALDQLIRTEVVPPFLARAIPGARVRFTGGLELHRDKPLPDTLDVIPMTLTIQ